MSTSLERGIIRIKPVYIGLYHYYHVYGSVCSPDVIGTPPISPPTYDELKREAERLVENFKRGLDLEFVRIEEPFIIKEHKDFRRLPRELDYDIDAILVGTKGTSPLELKTLSRFGIPIIRRADPDYLRALRVKKFLRQSKFLYIGEIPSFSAPNGPWDFDFIERRLGVRVRHIDLSEFFRIFDRIPYERAKEELEKWSKDFAKIIEPTEKDLIDVVKVYLTLRYLCEREDANGVAINCGRFTEQRPIVPCLAYARLIDEGIMCSCEGDITAMLSAFILHAVSGKAVLMGNFGYKPGMFGAKEGEVTIEHDVIPLSMATTKFIIRDYHGRKFGVTAYADIKAKQPITLLNIDSSLDKMMVIEGYTKGSEDGIHCRVIVHIDVKGDVGKIPEILVGSQHISMTFGHWLKTLKKVGELLGMEVLHL